MLLAATRAREVESSSPTSTSLLMVNSIREIYSVPTYVMVWKV